MGSGWSTPRAWAAAGQLDPAHSPRSALARRCCPTREGVLATPRSRGRPQTLQATRKKRGIRASRICQGAPSGRVHARGGPLGAAPRRRRKAAARLGGTGSQQRRRRRWDTHRQRRGAWALVTR